MRTTRLGVAVLALALLTTQTVRAQTPVVDVANLSYAIRIASKIYDIYKQKVEQRLMLARMRIRLADDRLAQYHTIPIEGTAHDTSRYASAFLTALNVGDARGDLYRTTVRAVGTLPGVVDKLPPDARALLRRQYGDIESADSVIERALHARAQVRIFSAGEMARGIGVYEDDALSTRTAHQDITARLDILSAGELLARRQAAMENLEVSHLLELQLMRAKREREAAATVARMQLATLTTPLPDRSRLTADLQSSWRQP